MKTEFDVETALELFSRSYYLFARSAEVLPVPVIVRLLRALKKKQPRDPAVLFLQTAYDESAPEASWRAGVNALKAFGAFYTWGSKPKRERLLAIAANPRLLSATQTACVGASEVPDEYLAVLAIDASETSMDALLPHFAAAMKDPTRLDGLSKVAPFAKKTPALTGLLAQVDRQLEARQSASPSMSLARELGVATGPRFRAHVRLDGTPKGRASLDVLLDSAGADDHRVWIFGENGRTTFSAHSVSFDDLGMGRCSLPELPAWLARLQEPLGVRWKQDKVWTAYLRGKRLSVFLGWLLGPSRSR